MHGACDIIFYFLIDCYLLKIVYLLTIVAFSCSSSSRGSDCNRDASSVFPPFLLYFCCISIV